MTGGGESGRRWRGGADVDRSHIERLLLRRHRRRSRRRRPARRIGGRVVERQTTALHLIETASTPWRRAARRRRRRAARRRAPAPAPRRRGRRGVRVASALLLLAFLYQRVALHQAGPIGSRRLNEIRESVAARSNDVRLSGDEAVATPTLASGDALSGRLAQRPSAYGSPPHINHRLRVLQLELDLVRRASSLRSACSRSRRSKCWHAARGELGSERPPTCSSTRTTPRSALAVQHLHRRGLEPVRHRLGGVVLLGRRVCRRSNSSLVCRQSQAAEAGAHRVLRVPPNHLGRLSHIRCSSTTSEVHSTLALSTKSFWWNFVAAPWYSVLDEAGDVDHVADELRDEFLVSLVLCEQLSATFG